jgi:DNA polymerase-3 subunit delta
LGPERGEKQEAVDDLRKRLRGAGAAAEEISFYAGETPMGDIVSVLRNGSLFSDSRLIFHKNAENLKKKDEIDALSAYLVDPADNTALVILSDEPSIAKPIENAVPQSCRRMFYEMFENRKRGWLVDFFKKQGFAVSADGVDAVLELVENSTDALRRE